MEPMTIDVAAQALKAGIARAWSELSAEAQASLRANGARVAVNLVKPGTIGPAEDVVTFGVEVPPAQRVIRPRIVCANCGKHRDDHTTRNVKGWRLCEDGRLFEGRGQAWCVLCQSENIEGVVVGCGGGAGTGADGRFAHELCYARMELGELREKAEKLEAELDVRRRSSPEDIVARGWSLEAHSEYEAEGRRFSLWSFSNADDTEWIDARGASDAEALDYVRQAIAQDRTGSVGIGGES